MITYLNSKNATLRSVISERMKYQHLFLIKVVVQETRLAIGLPSTSCNFICPNSKTLFLYTI